MKKVFATLAVIFMATVSNAQMVNGSAYMQGLFVEIAIDSLGGYEGVDILTSPVPAGMHPRTGGPTLFGFVANPQMDGWVNFDGDYYTPGTPENGWGFEFIDTTSTDTFYVKAHNNCAIGTPSITGSVTSYSYTAGVTTVTWHGDYLSLGSGYDLDFDIVYTLGDSDLFYNTSVTIFNNGPANIEEFYYYRNIDPDNNQSIGGSFVTTNTIVSQPDPFTSVASVKAEQTIPWLSTFAFWANDTSARVSKGGFSNRDGTDIWNAASGLTGATGSISTNDEAVSIAFRQPGLVSFTRSGGTSSATFSFSTVFDAAVVDELTQNAPHLGIEETTIEGLSVYPNPANEILNVSAKDKLNKITIYNALGAVVYTNTNVNSTLVQIDISSYGQGMYFLGIEGENGNVTKKIIKK